MKEFKNPKAQELYLASLELEIEASMIAEEEMKQVGCVLDNGSCEMFMQAAGLRVMADDLEAGLLTEEEYEMLQ